MVVKRAQVSFVDSSSLEITLGFCRLFMLFFCFTIIFNPLRIINSTLFVQSVVSIIAKVASVKEMILPFIKEWLISVSLPHIWNLTFACFFLCYIFNFNVTGCDERLCYRRSIQDVSFTYIALPAVHGRTSTLTCSDSCRVIEIRRDTTRKLRHARHTYQSTSDISIAVGNTPFKQRFHTKIGAIDGDFHISSPAKSFSICNTALSMRRHKTGNDLIKARLFA
mmetsp:Transcript_26586/g.48082  ORF Transcript_26586/g.48082 Transcript_26586/m.48082 type:complete len:223 (-) Transcript_26586:2613-3281(-)